jgi:hypothetical protein
MITVEGYTKTETCLAEIRYGPFSTEFVLEDIDGALGAPHSEKIVDVHRDEEYASVSSAIVYTMFTFETFEPPGKHGIVHRPVPNKATLFHPIQSFLQLPNPIWMVRVDKSFGLLHVADFVGFE